MSDCLFVFILADNGENKRTDEQDDKSAKVTEFCKTNP